MHNDSRMITKHIVEATTEGMLWTFIIAFNAFIWVKVYKEWPRSRR